MADLPTFVTHLECSATGKRYEADRLHGLSEAGKPLLVRYDLDALGRAVTKEAVARRDPERLRRYRPGLRNLLPPRRALRVLPRPNQPRRHHRPIHAFRPFRRPRMPRR